MAIHIALPIQAKAQLETALVLYRKALADLETAIASEAWGNVNRLQGSRDLQAQTIAAIVNRYALSLVGEGALV